MSIKLDWDISEAPNDDDAAPRRFTTGKDSTHQGSIKSKYGHETETSGPAAPVRRWSWWLVGLTILAMLAGGSVWYLTRAGWQTVNIDIAAAITYEDQQSALGATNLLLNVQDQGNVDWLSVRRDEVQSRQPAPRPVPMLNFGAGTPNVVGLAAIDADFVNASVIRQFSEPNGQSLSFSLPQFYRRASPNTWLRSAPPGSFWGNWLDWQGSQLLIHYSERDAAFVTQVAPELERRLADACAVWTGGCSTHSPVRLYLSGFVGSLEYDPLSNVEVRIAPTGTAGQTVTPSDYYLSVPSPQIAGIPADDASRSYLADYLAVRLIATLARHTSTSTDGYFKRTSQAIQALELSQADPGYLGSGQRQRSAAGGHSLLMMPPMELTLSGR